MPMRNLLSQLLAIGPELAAFILTSPLLASHGVHAFTQDVAPSPHVDISQLGRVAIAGDFDSISVFQYEGQNENHLVTNGSQSLLTQFPNGAFDAIAQSDAVIESMCQFERDGKVQGIVVGGNFTSLGGTKAPSVAFWHPDSNTITPLGGLTGSVLALYCDNDSGTLYAGGMFAANRSQNAMAYTTKWTDLPFAGFNGPVNSITKNSAGNILFGGQFDGLGNTTTSATPKGQVVNLAGGSISAEGSTSTAGFSHPANIICQTGQDGPGNTWLLSDNRQGYWQGNYSFGFIPTKLRLYNTKHQGRGTKVFTIEDMDSGGILELTYQDNSGNNQTCAGACPLQHTTNAQDFIFASPVGFNGFRIWINEWYGDGGGLSGIEMFQNDIYSFAINNFNEPTCDNVSTAAKSTVSPASGLWQTIVNNGTTTSNYLSAYLTSDSQVNSASVVFQPEIEISGNYSITVYTPGCVPDNTCSTRGLVNITGSMTSGEAPVTSTIAQTNDYDKYDQIYFGMVDVNTDTFVPSVTLTPLSGQTLPQTVVAQRVRFDLVTTTGGLNGLYEWNPNESKVKTDFSSSTIDSAGNHLDTGALVNTIIEHGNTLYVGGNFTGNGISNVMSVTSKAKSLPGGGLNAGVQSMYLAGSTLYLGGNFTNTADNTMSSLHGVASYDTDSSKWIALGAGVNGMVMDVVPMSLNVTMGNLEECITVNGDFSSVHAFGNNDAFDADGFAVWVPSHKNWLNNIPNTNVAVDGKLFFSANVSSLPYPLYSGQLISQTLGLSGAVEMVGSGEPSLRSLGIQIQNSAGSASKRKRAIDTSQADSGVYTGLFYDENGRNITVFGGHFAATDSNGKTVHDILIVESKGSSQTVTGVSELHPSSTIAAMAYEGSLLFAGGSISGKVDGNDLSGLLVWNLQTNKAASPQPPALAGGNVVVNAITVQDKTNFVYVGGQFTTAGSLPCATLCYYDTSVQQWNSPGFGLSGTITSMIWTSKTELVIAGDLTVHGAKTRMAMYDSKKQVFSAFDGASTLPGEITALTPASSNLKDFWAAGVASKNNSAYLSLYQNSQWTSVGGLGASTVIRGLQVLSLTKGHDSTKLVSSDDALMLLGNINIPGYGNASAVLYNGTGFEPFLLTNKDDGTQGSIASMFVSKPQNLNNIGNHFLAVGFIVLIGLAIALGLIFLVVVAGILMERARRRREGYVPMARTSVHNGNMAKIPPETLLGGLSEKGSAAPKV